MKTVRTFGALALRPRLGRPDTISKPKPGTHQWIDLFSSLAKVRELQTSRRFKGAKVQTLTMLRHLIARKIRKVNKNRAHRVTQALVSSIQCLKTS